jgi:hypothetical protein
MRALRNGFEPLFRLEVYDRLKHLETGKCPFDNLPERKRTPWSITREENEKLRLAQARIGCTNRVCGMAVEDQLRHSRFVGVRRRQGCDQLL